MALGLGHMSTHVRRPLEPPGLFREASTAKAEMEIAMEEERQRDRERRERFHLWSPHCSWVQVLGPKRKSACHWLFALPEARLQTHGSDTGCSTEAPSTWPSLLSRNAAP